MDRSIRLSFENACSTARESLTEAEPSKRLEKREKSLQLLTSALSLLKMCRTATCHPDALHLRSPELLVVAAESCLECGEVAKAKECAEDFFKQKNCKDQYHVRALFTMARCEAQLPPATPPPLGTPKSMTDSTQLNGAEEIRRVLRATKYITRALEIARGNDSYKFLIYNGSVHFWNICRLSMREGARRYLAKPLTYVCDCLNEIDDDDWRWRIQLNSELVNALDEAGELSSAANRVNAVIQLAMTLATKANDELAEKEADCEGCSARIGNIVKAIRKLSGEELENGIDGDVDGAGDEEKKQGGNDDDGDNDEEFANVSLQSLEETLLVAEQQLAKLDDIKVEASAAAKSAAEICEKTALLRLHVGRNAPTNGDCKKILDEGEKDKSMFQDAEKADLKILLQKIKSGILDGKDDKDKKENVEKNLSAVLSQLTPEQPTDQDPGDKDKNKEVSVQLDVAEYVVDCGNLASKFGFDSLAQQCVDLCKTGKFMGSPHFRIKLDFLKSAVLAKELDGKKSLKEDLVPGIDGKNSNANEKKNAASKKKDLLKPAKLDARHVDALKLSRRVEALKLLDRTLMSARRLGDPDLLQEGAVLAWNLGLPLLQPHLRKHAHRVFTLAAQVLSEISSPLVRLRAMLHYEVAKCELASDFLAKASKHVTDSINQDYGEIDEERVIAPELTLDEPECYESIREPTSDEVSAMDSNNDKLRSLDRYTLPMVKKLELRTSIYKEPSNLEEKALLQLEQAKEVSDVGLQRTLLEKSALWLREAANGGGGGTGEGEADMDGVGGVSGGGGGGVNGDDVSTATSAYSLAELCDVNSKISKGEGEPMVAPSPTLKRQTSLWSDIVSMAWDLRHVELVRTGSVPILSNIWHPKNNREFVVLQVKCQFTLAESMVESLKNTSLPPIPIATSNKEDGKDGEDDLAATLKKRTDPRALGVKCERGSLLSPPEAWADRADELKVRVVGAISAGIQRAKILGSSGGFLVETGAVLLWNYHIHIFRAQAYSSIMVELTEALKVAHEALIEVGSKDVELMAYLSEALALSSESVGDLAGAESWCMSTIPLGERPMQVKRLVVILARIKYNRGGKDYAPTVDAKAGQVANPLFEVCANMTVVGQLASKVGKDASEAERGNLLSASLGILKKVREDRLAAAESGGAGGGGGDDKGEEKTLEDDEEQLQFEAELWARLAKESLGQNLLRQAQFCCSCCIEQLPVQPELRKRVPVNVWRWFSCAECLWGRSIAAMVNADGQDRSLQDELRRAALKHLVTAARHGGRARQPLLVTAAAKFLWNIVLPLTTSPISRKQIFPFVKQTLTELSQSGVRSDPEFRLDLYILLLECYNDVEDFNGGLEAVNEAFLQIPPELQRDLWQRRVVFMSKLGKGVLDGMQKMKEGDPVLQARVWAILARAASSTKQQMSAYVQAVDSLSDRFERLEYCVEMAEWMVQTGLSKRDSNDVLTSAVDAFLDVEGIELGPPDMFVGGEDDWEEGEGSDGEGGDEDGDGGRSTAMTARSAGMSRKGHSRSGSIMSRQGTAQVSRRGSATSGGAARMGEGGGSRPGSHATLAGGAVPEGSQGNLQRSGSRSSVRSAKTSHSNSGAATAMSTKAGSRGGEGEMPATLNVYHMSLFIKTLAMISKAADGYKVRLDNAISASHYAERCLLLNISAASDGKLAADYEKLDEEERLKAGGLSEYIKNCGVVFSSPTSIAGWCDFQVTEEIVKGVKGTTNNRHDDIFSSKTINKAPLTIEHLFYCADVLVGEGMALQALPLLIMAEFIGHTVTPTRNENLISLCTVKVSKVLFQLGRMKEGLDRLKKCGELGLSESNIKMFREEVEQIEILKVDKKAKRGLTINDEEGEFEGTVEDARGCKLKRFEARHLWARLAEECVDLEQANTATQYLDEALRHCLAYDDLACEAQCLLTKGKVAMINGDLGECILCVKRCMVTLGKRGGGEGRIWAEASILIASAVNGPPNYARGEAKGYLKQCREVLEKRIRCNPEMMREAPFDGESADIDLDAVNGFTRVSVAYAHMLAGEAMENRDGGGPWRDLWEEAMSLLEENCNLLAELSDGTEGESGSGEENSSAVPRPCMLLVDTLQLRSEWLLRMRAGEKYEEDLKASITILTTANRIMLDHHRFVSPPEGAVGDGGGAKPSSSEPSSSPLEPSGSEQSDLATSEAITLPTARRCASLQLSLSSLHTLLATHFNEHVSSREEEAEYNSRVTDPVTRYIDATAPRETSDADSEVTQLQQALFYATSARKLARGCPLLGARADGALGGCLTLICGGRGLLDDAWDESLSVSASVTDLSVGGGLTPSPSAVSLLAEGAGGGGKGGKGKGKEKKGKGGGGGGGGKGKGKEGEDGEAGGGGGPAVGLHFTGGNVVEIDETGDIRQQALSLLTTAGGYLHSCGRHEEASSCFMYATSAAGSAVDADEQGDGIGRPLDALRNLLKAQSASCDGWFRGLRADATDSDPKARGRKFERRMRRVGAMRGDIGGNGGNKGHEFLEDSCFLAPIGGRFGTDWGEFPPAKAAQAYLSTYSNSHRRMAGGTVAGEGCDTLADDLLTAIDESFRLLSFQMNDDKTVLFASVASNSKLPSIARVNLGEEEREILEDVLRRMEKVGGSSFSKFMLRYADEAGDEGDFKSNAPEAEAGPEVEATEEEGTTTRQVSEKEAADETEASALAASSSKEERKDAEKKEAEGIIMEDIGESEIVAVIDLMKKLLKPILSKPQIASALAEAKTSNASVIVIPDYRLQLLPFEALDELSDIESISRDFSGQMLLHRLVGATAGMPSLKGGGVNFIADPRFEDHGSAVASKPRRSISAVVKEITSGNGFGSGFKGICGDDHMPSTGEWQSLLTGDGETPRAFLYYGPGRALARFDVCNLVGLNTTSCQLVALIGQSENDSSYRRQSKLDNTKRGNHIKLEQSIESAALFSLAGANCVLTNRWANSGHANNTIMKGVIGEMALNGVTVGASVNSKFRKMSSGEGKGDKLKARVAYNTVVFGLPNIKFD